MSRAEELSRIVHDAWVEIARLAFKGDTEAQDALVKWSVLFESEASRLLNESQHLKAKLGKAAYWPAQIPANKARREKLMRNLFALGFASNCELDERNKAFSARAPITKAVIATWGLIRHLRTMKKKPPTPICFHSIALNAGQRAGWEKWACAYAKRIPAHLTKTNAPALARLTKPLLAIFWGKDFEKHQHFSSYRNASATTAQQKDTIRKGWLQSWESITPEE